MDRALNNIGNYMGIQVFSSPLAVSLHKKQVRFPRTHKKRIVKKWKKNPKNFITVETPAIYFLDANKDMFCIHPSVIRMISTKIERFGNEYADKWK